MLSEVVTCLSGNSLAHSVKHLYNQMKGTFSTYACESMSKSILLSCPNPLILALWEGSDVLEGTHSGLASAFPLKKKKKSVC